MKNATVRFLSIIAVCFLFNLTAGSIAVRAHSAAIPRIISYQGIVATDGVVTSMNELGGALRIQGDSAGTVTVSEDATHHVLTLHSNVKAGLQSIASPDGTLAIKNGNGPDASVDVADNSISTQKLQDAS